LPGEVKLARGCFFALVLPFLPFGVVSAVSLIYLLASGREVGPQTLTGMAFCAGWLFWFLFPVLLLRRFTALGYWWAAVALAVPLAAGLALGIRDVLAHGAPAIPFPLLVGILLGIPLVLLLKARRAYFTRLRLIQEGPTSITDRRG
jgi:hypothetical protein